MTDRETAQEIAERCVGWKTVDEIAAEIEPHLAEKDMLMRTVNEMGREHDRLVRAARGTVLYDRHLDWCDAVSIIPRECDCGHDALRAALEDTPDGR